MIIHIKNDLVTKDSKGNQVVAATAGASLTVINWCYISPDTEIQNIPFYMNKNKKELEKDYFVVYIRGTFFGIKKTDCEIPVTNGWLYNI